MNKELIIVGGANGVGKTTIAHQYQKEFEIEYLGADDIAIEIASVQAQNIELKAGREFFKRLDHILANEQSIIIESTLAGVGLARKIQAFKECGYSVHIVYVFLNHISVCKNRISLRVKKGGHPVPAADVDRRFKRSIQNFLNIYKPLADKWQIIYNGFEKPVEVIFCDSGGEIIFDEDVLQKFMELAQ